jgi:hypothetical protein
MTGLENAIWWAIATATMASGGSPEPAGRVLQASEGHDNEPRPSRVVSRLSVTEFAIGAGGKRSL